MNQWMVQVQSLWEQAWVLWLSGGWAMPAIALTAVVMFGIGVHLQLKFYEKGFLSVPEKTWRHWIDHPKERSGPIGEMLEFVTGAQSLREMGVVFGELRTTEIAPLARDLKVMKICVGVAPLLGLLGTVTGMITTFGALSSGSGGEKTMALVASGISEALITTMTGLVIALPGLFFQYQLARKYDRYKTFLMHLETVCTQRLYRRIKALEKLAAKHSMSSSGAAAPTAGASGVIIQSTGH